MNTSVKNGEFTKAWDSIKNCVVDVKDLPRSRNGLKCGCICVECQTPLEACQGLIRKWYFRHQSQTNCNGGPMTAIHLLAQQLLVGSQVIQTGSGPVSYESGEIEYRIPSSNYKTDVAGVKADGARIAIEIFVSHRVDEMKLKFLREQKIHSLEIDISDIDFDIKPDDLLHILLNDSRRQKVIFEPTATQELVIRIGDQSEAVSAKPWYENPWIIVPAIVGLVLFLWPSKKNRSRNR